MGEDKVGVATSDGSLTFVIIILLSGLVLVLLAVLTFMVIMLRNSDLSENDVRDNQDSEDRIETQMSTANDQPG